MAVELAEQRLGDVRWIVLRGPAQEAFGSLGEHMRTEISEVVTGWQPLAELRSFVAEQPGRERLAAVRQASETGFPDVWAELAAMAGGANVPLDDLALLNFRGDVGATRPAAGGQGAAGGRSGQDAAGHAAAVAAADGAGTGHGATGGCSDLAWRRERSFVAHNEDDSGFYQDRSAVLTLLLDDLQPVTAFWKAGFLPSNAFTVTGSGMVWSLDSLTAEPPGPGAGRHVVARKLQQVAVMVGQAVEYLRQHPSAGGFSYTIGDSTGRVVVVETSAGQHAWREATPQEPLLWHTNHGRYVAGADPVGPADSSLSRGEVLKALQAPAGEPDADWFARALAGAPEPGGVRVDPSERSDVATLCTFVINLTDGAATVIQRGTAPVTIPLGDLAHGRPGRVTVSPRTGTRADRDPS
jgi:acyl-CoA:6-aminopenicillanic acid acyl transferase